MSLDGADTAKHRVLSWHRADMTEEMVQHQLPSYEGKVELRLVPDPVPEQQVQSQRGGRCDRRCHLAVCSAVPVRRSMLSLGSCTARTGLSVHRAEKLELSIQRFAAVKVY